MSDVTIDQLPVLADPTVDDYVVGAANGSPAGRRIRIGDIPGTDGGGGGGGGAPSPLTIIEYVSGTGWPARATAPTDRPVLFINRVNNTPPTDQIAGLDLLVSRIP